MAWCRTYDEATTSSSLRCGWMRLPWSSRTRLACRSSRPAATAPLDGSRLLRGWPGRPEGWRQAWRHLPIPHHHLQRVKRGRRQPAGFSAAVHQASGTARGLRTGPGRYRSTWWDRCSGVMERPRRRCRRRVRAPAPGHGAAVVAATRPIPRRHQAGSRARGVPAGPPAAALDPGPGGAGRRPRRPPGAAGARPAGRELPPQGDSAGIGLGCSVLRDREWRPGCAGRGVGGFAGWWSGRRCQASVRAGTCLSSAWLVVPLAAG
jgi:hypothetical protein